MMGKPSGQHTVMVVDDSATVRAITRRFLERAGFQVVLAKDGMEAVDMLEARGIRPDAMLLDVEMPRMDGFEVVRLVRAMPAFGHLPILMVTSDMAAEHRARAMRLGATRYIGKPYEEAALLEEIKKCIVEARRSVTVATL